MAHSDPAQYNRYSEISVWHGGKQIDSKNGILGEAVNHFSRSIDLPTVSPIAPKSVERGGIQNQSGLHGSDWGRTSSVPTVWRS